jgi:hypothetical protein
MVRLEGLSKLKKSTLSGTRTGDLPACSIVPQPTTLLRAPIQTKVGINKPQMDTYLSNGFNKQQININDKKVDLLQRI